MTFIMRFYLFLVFTLSSAIISLKAQEEANLIIKDGVNAMVEKDYSKSLELLNQAKELAIKNQWYEQQFLAINNIGANYYNMLDYGKALEYYLEAYTIAIKDLEPQQEMIVLNNIAILYSKEEKFDKSEEYFLKAYDIAKKNNAAVNLSIYAINLASVANKKNELSKARSFLDEAINLSQESPDFLLEAKALLVENYLLRDNTESSKKLAFELLPQLNDVTNSELKNNLLLLISRAFAKENHIEDAITYAEMSVEASITLESKINAFEQLSNLLTKNESYMAALNIKDSLIIAKEKLNTINDGQLFERSKEKFEIENYKKELSDQQQEIKKERKTFYTILGAALLLFLLIIWALRNQVLKNKQRKILEKRNQEILTLELEKEKNENLLLEKQLKSEIESKNRKLSAKALFLSDRNKLVTTIISELEANNTLEHSSTIKQHIKNLKSYLKTDEEWDSFIKHFEEVNQGFLSNLKRKHTSINANDIRFISYVYMDLSPKEIATVFNITPEACRKRKERISKKLGLGESNDLYHYLASL